MTNTADRAMLIVINDSGSNRVRKDEDIRGRKVDDSGGAHIGHVADLLVDEREHTGRFMLVDQGFSSVSVRRRR